MFRPIPQDANTDAQVEHKWKLKWDEAIPSSRKMPTRGAQEEADMRRGGKQKLNLNA